MRIGVDMSMYGLRFIDSIEKYDRISLIAYYKWIDGSADSEMNWIEAERIVLGMEDEKVEESVD